MTGESAALLALWCAAALGCLLGIARPAAGDAGVGVQLVDLLRVVCTTALVLVLVLGPGLACRAVRPGSLRQLGFLPLPGMAALAGTGALAWAVGLEGWVHPRVVSSVILGPVLVAMLAAGAYARGKPLLDPEERRALLVAGAALGLAIGRALWSLSPPGELYAGTIYRTLEVSDRPDSRISFHIVQLVANGAHPYGSLASSFFSPYTFSDRGPLPALASAPIALVSGGRPPAAIGTPPWTPFDPEGFMAYRLAMMTFASTALLSAWTLARRLAGPVAARVALLLCATTPFLVHEIWFTWPKLLAASMVLLAAVWLLDRKPFRSGLFVGIGYLCHPLTLLSLPVLVLGTLWPGVRPHWRRPRARALLLLVAGCAICLIAWRIGNGSHYTQNGFLDYVKQDGFTNTLRGYPVTLGAWLSDRGTSLANTLVPLRLFLLSSSDQEINAVQACFPFCHGGSPGIVHFFYQYWTGVPFGLGILFFPLLLLSVWFSLRRWPWPTAVAVLLPLAVFTVYWGGASTGMLREGMHVWALTLVLVVVLDQATTGFPYMHHAALRAILVSRAVEVLLVAILPTILTTHRALGRGLATSDAAAMLVMVAAAGLLATAVWRERAAPPGSEAAVASPESSKAIN